MLILTAEDIKKVFTMKDAIQADKDALRLYSEGKSNIPLRVNIDVPKHKGQSLYMPGYVEDLNALGIKIVSVFPENTEKGKPSVPAKMVLLDGETGEVCAIMDGTYLTQLRTGAVAGAATDVLARKDAKVAALIGTGGQAPAQLEAILAVRDIEIVKVFGMNREKAKVFAEKMDKDFSTYGAKIIAVENVEDAIKDADIITTVTTSKNPTFDGKLVKKGAHINGVGSYTPDVQELDEYIITNCNKIYMDTRDGVLSEAGDFIIPINKGIFKKESVTGELGELLSGTIKGREKEEEITLFKSVGSAVLDIVTAYRIYEKAKEANIGTNIEF